MFDRGKFDLEKTKNIKMAYANQDLHKSALEFVTQSDRLNYAYSWTWLGLPIIQMPEDVVLTQEIIWDVKPNVVIETGIAWGGSIALSASILELIGKDGRVFGIDKVLPQHNIEALMKYNFSKRIKLFEGSSTDQKIVNEIGSSIKPDDKVVLMLDSNHTAEHVYNELLAWSPFVKSGGYIIVSDTVIEEIPEQTHRPRVWGKGNNPSIALNKFLSLNNRFTRENDYNLKAIASYTRNGYVKCL